MKRMLGPSSFENDNSHKQDIRLFGYWVLYADDPLGVGLSVIDSLFI